MDLPFLFIDMVLHIDKYLQGITETYGIWVYLILFAIIFCETGLVVTPYLPGDSLLFVAGTLAGAGFLNIELLIAVLLSAALLGDNVNYWVGHTIGMKVLEGKYSFVRPGHLDKTKEYFTRYGGITIVIGRFIPFIRTFAPFLAGVGAMRYRRFLSYDTFGGCLWVLSFTLAGFFFGGLPVVKEHFSLVVYAIIGGSLIAVGSIVMNMIRHPVCDGQAASEEEPGQNR